MQNISNRLAETHLHTLHKLVDEIYQAPEDAISVSFWSGVSLTLPNHRGSISLTSIISKLLSLYKNMQLENQAISFYMPSQQTQKILHLYSAIEERATQKVKGASKITQIFLIIKRFFVKLFWINRQLSADRLEYITLQMIEQCAKFHLTSIPRITNGYHQKGTQGNFFEKLPAEFADNAVVLTSLCTATDKVDFRHKPIPDCVELTSDSHIDILATNERNFKALQEQLMKSGLAHRFAVITLDQLTQDIKKTLNLSSCLAEYRLPWSKEDFDNLLMTQVNNVNI